jgi:hypothetical protein
MSQNQSVSGIIQILHEALNPIRSSREKKKKKKGRKKASMKEWKVGNSLLLFVCRIKSIDKRFYLFRYD